MLDDVQKKIVRLQLGKKKIELKICKESIIRQMANLGKKLNDFIVELDNINDVLVNLGFEDEE